MGVSDNATKLLFAVAVALLGTSALAVAGIMITGGNPTDAPDDLLIPALGCAVLAALLGWRHDRAASESHAARKSSETERLMRQLEDERRRGRLQQEALARERNLRARIDRARRAEREWAAELRQQIAHLYDRRGLFTGTDDMPSLVLRLARELVEADKGLLLARSDEDGDGELDLVCHEGFDSEPGGSAIAQRFAREVLERDRIVREDRPDLSGVNGATPADDEIDNLVAVPIFIHDRFTGVVVCANRDGGFEDLDDDVLLALGDQAGAALENSRLQGALRRSYLAIIGMLAEGIESRDPRTSAQTEHLSRVVSTVGDRLGLPASRREQLIFAWMLHDVGKLGISEQLLMKPGPLTARERRVMELHSHVGARLVERVPALGSIASAVLHHHERFDGTGYPARLSGDRIPLEARIIAVADAFAAMTSERTYRAPVATAEALTEIERCAGTQFDPDVVSAFAAEIVRRPPSDVAPRLDDTRVEAERQRDEPVLGHGSAGLTDNLTLLYSHSYLYESIDAEARRALARGIPFTVVLIELTDLPAINERDGYAAGDRALVAAARAIERVAARHGGVGCRYSGRRLAVLLPGREPAPWLNAEVAAELKSEGVRAGIAVVIWQPGDTGRDVIGRARAALRLPAAAPPESV
jgi:HD-GYP domain-containing protein (c-di-GMP phosphodiesterase class II)/GGDEF domain-containing protein